MPEPSTPSFLRPAFLTALLAALGSLAVAAVFVLAARGSADQSFAGFARSATRTWLVSLGSGLEAGDISLGLVPIGATLICITVVALTASWIVVDPVELPAFAATAAGASGVIAGIGSAASNAGDIHTSVVRAAVGAFVVGGLGSAIGAALRHRATADLWPTPNADVRAVVRASVPGVLAVLAASAVIVLALLIVHIARAGDLWAVLDPGFGGGFALALGCVLAIPTLVLWTASALIGPGFALGTDTSVDLSGAHLGEVPGLPVLAALPAPGQFAGWVFVLGLVPLAAGALAGWKVDPGEREDLLTRVGLGAGAGGLAGLVLGLLIAVSGGAVGPGRMADAGPPMLTPLLVAVPVMALGGVIGALLGHYRGARATQPEDASTSRGPRLWKRHQPPSPDRRVDES
ncbi:hypothetical protein GCM10022234_25030 [Aeromicrobium panaciterrae]|uniref:cell division protein PerM n=1 Tax=Aeromicrobium panaciterrae TaxID=363861 RepID=UPI0031DD643B